jgi:hypothetical protein
MSLSSSAALLNPFQSRDIGRSTLQFLDRVAADLPL